MSLRLAVATEDFDTSLRKAIGRATTCGVAGVRLNSRSEIIAGRSTESSLRQILHYVKERQMKVAGLICPTRHSLYDSEYLEPRIDIIRKSMSVAKKLETNELIVRCGQIPDPDSVPEPPPAALSIDEQTNPFSFGGTTEPVADSPSRQFSRLCEILTDLADHGNHVGCVLNLQLAAYDLRLTKRLLSAVNSGPLNICLDTSIAIRTGPGPENTFRELYQNIGYVRARDTLRDVEAGESDVGIGDGVVDWMQLMPTLAEADFRGWICVERTGGSNRADDVRRGASMLKQLIPQTGD